MQVRRDPEAIPAASIGDNQAETGRRTNITSGTGYGGRSELQRGDSEVSLEGFRFQRATRAVATDIMGQNSLF